MTCIAADLRTGTNNRELILNDGVFGGINCTHLLYPAYVVKVVVA
jgi:hypothetical protein